MKLALLELKDSVGLKALSEVGAFYYLQNDLTNAEKALLKTDLEKVDPFRDCLSKRIEVALREATSSLENWPETNGIKSLDKYVSRNLWEEIKTNHQSMLQEEQDCDAVKCLQQMHTTTESLGSRLTVSDLQMCVDTLTTDPTVRSLHYFNLADLFYNESQMAKSAELYTVLANLMELNGHDLNPAFKAKIYISCAAKLESSPAFFGELVPQLEPLSILKNKGDVLQYCYEKATVVCPVDFNAWIEYGNFSYSMGHNSSTEPRTSHALKVLAQQCYSNCLALEDNGTRHNASQSQNMEIKTRMLALHKAGYKFNPENVLIRNDWLQLLPSLTRNKDLRTHLVGRFPDHASFVAAAYSRERLARVVGRRGVFDPHAFTFTEASDDMFNPVCHCSKDGTSKRNWTHKTAENDVAAKEHEGLGTKNLINPNVYAIIEELERIGTSREELWSWAIEKIISDASKKLSALRKDMARESDVSKVKAYTLPLLTYLSELWNNTKEASTPAECAFLNKYGSKIKQLLKDLKSCSTADDFNSALDEIIGFGSAFGASAVSRLDLNTVSPKLANLEFNSSSAVHIPGFPEQITLSGIHPIISCLHTKAKPKRLSFRGSNGRLYDYLVKGNENLNIDCGVMQLLNISQGLISLPTRTYSITPFGERGGFIQIVENAQPLYIMYKRHLQRVNCSERPALMFFRLLNDLGFSDRSNFDALKTVYETLVKETDPEIISRELFICAENASDWLSSTRTFTQDAAVGASIGHLVGIGDRHLDNILLNPGNGNLVHVDFSLLFGRGTTLQVPEIVPFRLTQNFVSCMQYPGIDGPFRVYMENVFDLLKQHNDSFMFGVEEIALATQIDEHATVDSASILLSELNSAVALLRFRSRNIKNALQALKVEVLEIIDRRGSEFTWSGRSESISSTEKLKKKLNRWRRLLCNVDPLIQFIGKFAKSDVITLQSFQETVVDIWLPNVIHFWCHTNVDKLFESTPLFPDQLNLADETLLLLLSTLPTPDTTLHCNELLLTKEEVDIDYSKIQSQMLGTKEKFTSYNEQTIDTLISSATSADNLCQMFEGWTAWV